MEWGQHHCVTPTVEITADQVPLKQNRSPTISLVQYCMWPPTHVQLKCDGYNISVQGLPREYIHITALRVQIPYSVDFMKLDECMTLWGEPEQVHMQNLEQLHVHRLSMTIIRM